MSRPGRSLPIVLAAALALGQMGDARAQTPADPESPGVLAPEGRKFAGRLRSISGGIERYRSAGAIADPGDREAALRALDEEGLDRRLQRDLLALFDRASRRLTGERNLARHLRLGQLGVQYVVAVRGEPAESVVPAQRMERARRLYRQGDPRLFSEVDSILMDLEESIRRGRRAPASAGGAAKPGGSAVPAGPGKSSRALLRRLLVAIALGGASLGALATAWAMRARSRRRPVVAPHLARLMELYIQKIHPIKNAMGAATRFEGDPDGLSAALYEPSTLGALLGDVEAATHALAGIRQALAPAAAADGDLGQIAGLVGEGLSIHQALAPRLRDQSVRAGDPAARGEVAREAKVDDAAYAAFAARLVGALKEVSVDLVALAEGVVARRAGAAACSVAASSGLPRHLFFDRPAHVRDALAASLAAVVDNGVQARAHRVWVSMGYTRAPDGGAGRVSLDVADDGCGVSEAVKARLFEPGATTKPGGTGMGLYGVRRAMEDLAGTASVSSRPGGGTVVHMELEADGI